MKCRAFRIVAASGSSTSLRAVDPKETVTQPTTLPVEVSSEYVPRLNSTGDVAKGRLVGLIADVAERAVRLDDDLSGSILLAARICRSARPDGSRR